MDALFRMVLTTSLYASIVGVIILILKSILKNRINPRWHYIIWIVLMLKLLVPFGPESALSIFNTVPQIPQNTNFTQIYEEYHQSYTDIVQSGEKADIPVTWVVQDSSLQFAAKAEKALPYAWFAGAILMLGWLLYTGYSLNRKMSKHAIQVPEDINRIFIECKEKMGVSSVIKIVIQDIISTPAIFGLFKPRILLSPDTLNLGKKELSYVLLHELAHYKRRDLPANHLLLLLQIIHWFNPVIWYCFKRIRQDMEIAADEQVLTLLEYGEHKEYGKTLLAVIEHFNLPRIAPRLIGMVDDKKSIEKRIRMIKMMDFFKKRQKSVFAIGILCVAILSSILLTSSLTGNADISTSSGEKAAALSNGYSTSKLLKFKSQYVGDNSNDANLLNSLPLAESRREISLRTEKQPYGMTVNYDFTNSILSLEEIEASFRSNAAVIFALIGNVDEIYFNSITAGGEQKYQYIREQMQSSYAQKLNDFAADENSLQTLINSFGLSFAAYPEKYSPAMSSTPGIRIVAQYGSRFDKVLYAVPYGTLLTWDIATGKITNYGQKAELTAGIPVYWGSLDNVGYKEVKEIPVKATIYYKDNKLAEKQMYINYDGMYSPLPSEDVIIADDAALESQSPKTLDEAVSYAILAQAKGYGVGEASTEGHVILDTEEEDDITKVYTIASYGAFGFENGIFTKTAGSGAIATVISFSGNEQVGYSKVEYRQPQDGALNLESKKKMFPKRLWNKILNEQNYYQELAQQQEEQAGQYLKRSNRKAEVTASYVEKKLLKINVEASNKIFAEHTKNDMELNNFPYWIGTKELVQDGVRYIYETSQGKTKDGNDMISFVKRAEDGSVAKEYHYEIIGNEPELLK